MPFVQAKSTILHNGTEYLAGETFEVTDEQAPGLFEAEVVVAARDAVEAEVVEGDGLDDKKFDELKEIATAEGIDIADLKSKDALREAIRAKRDAVEA